MSNTRREIGDSREDIPRAFSTLHCSKRRVRAPGTSNDYKLARLNMRETGGCRCERESAIQKSRGSESFTRPRASLFDSRRRARRTHMSPPERDALLLGLFRVCLSFAQAADPHNETSYFFSWYLSFCVSRKEFSFFSRRAVQRTKSKAPRVAIDFERLRPSEHSL